MERCRVRASFNGSLSPRSTFQTKASSPISLAPKSHCEEPLFSSNLQPKTPKHSSGDRIGCRIDDTEISIFDAERYFTEDDDTTKKKTIILNGIAENCNLSTNPRDSSVSSINGFGQNCRNRSFRATPTASSEVSWNSQSGLLSNPPGSVAVTVRAFPTNQNRRKDFSFSSRRRFLGRNCPCYCKKSVDVEEKYSEPKSPIRPHIDSNGNSGTVAISTTLDRSAPKEVEEVAKLKFSPEIWVKDTDLFSPEKQFPAEIGHRIVNSGRPFVESGGFSFPVLAPLALNSTEDPSRDSLEVFPPAKEIAVLRKSDEFQRRMASAAVADDDVESDTSSDLFEIESFSTHTAYRRRDSLDEFDPRKSAILQFRRSHEESAPSIAPSEVSVEWSVTTAEGGSDRTTVPNFSSAASDYEEIRFIQAEHDRFGSVMAAGNGSGVKKEGSGRLLSCWCEKAVRDGPNPGKFGPEQRWSCESVYAVEPDQVSGMARSHSARKN